MNVDEAWLKSLRFTSFGDIRITGLSGVGAENVAFEADAPDGTKVILKTPKLQLGFHIKEIPPSLTPQPLYNLTRVNEKLWHLRGNPHIDSMVQDYNRLFSFLLLLMHKHGFEGLMRVAIGLGVFDETGFIVCTPGFRARLADWATLSEAEFEFLKVNGPSFPFTETTHHLRQWSAEMLQKIDTLVPAQAEMKLDLLAQNPLWIWGGAAMDHFFTDDELSRVAQYIEQKFGKLAERPDAYLLISQAQAIGMVLAKFLDESAVARFVRLCALAGLVFKVTNRNGEVVADGLKFLLK